MLPSKTEDPSGRREGLDSGARTSAPAGEQKWKESPLVCLHDYTVHEAVIVSPSF